MPGTFLTLADRDRLMQFPRSVPHEDVITYFTLSEQDLAHIDTHRAAPHRLGVALQLCAVRYLGFCPADLNTAPADVLQCLAAQLEADPAALRAYGSRRKTRDAHIQAILTYLGFRRARAEDHPPLHAWLTDRALEHDRPTLLLQLACQHLKQQKILRPGITVLERLVAAARLQAHHELLRRLKPLLTSERTALLDELLVPDPQTGKTPLFWLQQHATSNTPSALLAALDKLTRLQRWAVDHWDLSALNPNRKRWLARLGRRYTSQAFQRMGPERRYPMLLALLKQTLTDLTDEIIDMFDACLAKTSRKAQRELEAHRQQVTQATEVKVELFHEMGRLVLDHAIRDEELRRAIYRRIPPDQLQAAVAEAEAMLHPNEYFDFLDDHYSYVRQFAPKLLDTIAFASNREDDPLLEAVEILRTLNASQQRKLPADAPMAVVTPRWRRFVFEQDQPRRRAYEWCVLWALRDALRAGDVYLSTSRRYANPETYLIPKPQWPLLREEVCQRLELDPTGAERLASRARELTILLPRLDGLLSRAEGVRMEHGALIVPAYAGEDPPESATALEELISQHLPQVELTDLLIEVDRWTGFSQHLTHAGGSQPRTVALLQHLYAVLLAQGSNMGLTEMAHSADLTYDRLAWASHWYLRDDTLKAATAALVNFQYRQPLARHWGGGTLSSSDGQRFPVSGKVRNAAALPRYFGYGKGITFYTWTSDQFSQYGTRVISATVRDATYVLDEILDNETELTILEHTTDTAGYTDIVFALFDRFCRKF